MNQRQVRVVTHFRKGKAVRGHNRNIQNANQNDSNIAKQPGPLENLLEEKAGQVFLMGEHLIDTTKSTVVENLNFEDAIIENIDLNKITEIKNCSFHNVLLRDIDLKNIKISNCKFEETKLQEVDLSNTIFEDCTFTRFKFKYCPLESTRFKKCSFRSSNFRDSQLTDTQFDSCVFNNTEITGSEADQPSVIRTGFTDCEMRDFLVESLDIEEATFNRCAMDIALSSIYANGLEIEECDVKKMSVSASILRNPKIVSSDFRETWWTETEIRRAHFSKTTIQKGAFQSSSIMKCEFDRVDFANFEMDTVIYEQFSFQEAKERLGVTDRQFEFLVLSGVVEVRDNETKKVVHGGFDTDKHHVPPWAKLKPVK